MQAVQKIKCINRAWFVLSFEVAGHGGHSLRSGDLPLQREGLLDLAEGSFPEGTEVVLRVKAVMGKARAAAIVVISAVDGIMNYADEAIKKASKKNQNNLSVFCNKMNLVDDDEDLELIMMEIENRLEDNNFPLDIKKGSALQALDGDAESGNTILQLLKKVENGIALAWEPPY